MPARLSSVARDRHFAAASFQVPCSAMPGPMREPRCMAEEATRKPLQLGAVSARNASASLIRSGVTSAQSGTSAHIWIASWRLKATP
eukprot:7675796-Pyramimonas_sp.AAC.1